jgi:hypothetical protein
MSFRHRLYCRVADHSITTCLVIRNRLKLSAASCGESSILNRNKTGPFARNPRGKPRGMRPRADSRISFNRTEDFNLDAQIPEVIAQSQLFGVKCLPCMKCDMDKTVLVNRIHFDGK